MPRTFPLAMFYTGFKQVGTWWNYKNIISPFHRLYYVEKGHAKVYINGTPYNLVPDTLFLIPKFTLHSYECTQFMSHYYICFFDNLTNNAINNLPLALKVEPHAFDLKLVKRYLSLNPNRDIKNSAPKYYDNNRFLHTLQYEKSSTNLENQIESQGILLQLFSRFITDTTSEKILTRNSYERLDSIIYYINTNLNKRITIVALATQMCLSADHFSKVFKKILGVSPNEYIQIKRIERAQFLLLTSNMSIIEIAEEVGIYHPSQFTRLFKKVAKCLPKDYRAKQLNI